MPTAAEKQADEAIAVALEFADDKLSVAEMADHVDLEAHRIEGNQRARLLAGLIEEPDHGEIVRAARLLTTARFLKSCADDPQRASNYFGNIAARRRAR